MAERASRLVARAFATAQAGMLTMGTTNEAQVASVTTASTGPDRNLRKRMPSIVGIWLKVRVIVLIIPAGGP